MVSLRFIINGIIYHYLSIRAQNMLLIAPHPLSLSLSSSFIQTVGLVLILHFFLHR